MTTICATPFFKSLMKKAIYFLLIATSVTQSKAEGTKQVAPNATDITMLLTNVTAYSNFAAYNSTADNRLNIHLNNPSSEQIYFGFSHMTNTGASGALVTTAYYFRVKNASGTVVFGPQLVDAATVNANTWAKANAGPAPIVGASGYTPFTYTPAVGAVAGDYYIEFAPTSAFNTNVEIDIAFWDITVATRTTPTALNGRVWSKRWAFRTESLTGGSDPTYGQFDRPFNGAVYTYSDDGFVNKIDFNNSGFRGLRFNMAFNQTGTTATGNVSNDRKSVAAANQSIAQYKLFLNNPDVTAYPSGLVGSLPSSPYVMMCPGSTNPCVAYTTTLPGLIQVILDFNATSGAGVYDAGTADVLLYETVTPAVGEVAPYKRCLTWNGKNGLGATVANGTAIPLYLTYIQGLVHFPVYDVEYNTAGFVVTSVRPTPSPGHTIKLRHDDVNITVASGSGEPVSNVFAGATPPAHKWTTFNFGNSNTINTWWYGSQVDINTAFETVTPTCSFTGPSAVCPSSTNTYTAVAGDTYQWSITGSGTINGSATGQSVLVDAGASGTYTLTLAITRSTCALNCNQTVTLNPSMTTPSVAEPVNNPCPSTTVDLTALSAALTPSVSGGIFEWHASNSSGSPLVSDATAVGAGTYYLFEKSPANCYSIGAAVTVNIVTCCPSPQCIPLQIIKVN